MEQSLVITEEKEKNIFEHKSLCFVEFDSDAESPDESDNENENSTKTQVKHDRNRIELCFFFLILSFSVESSFITFIIIVSFNEHSTSWRLSM